MFMKIKSAREEVYEENFLEEIKNIAKEILELKKEN